MSNYIYYNYSYIYWALGQTIVAGSITGSSNVTNIINSVVYARLLRWERPEFIQEIPSLKIKTYSQEYYQGYFVYKRIKSRQTKINKLIVIAYHLYCTFIHSLTNIFDV